MAFSTCADRMAEVLYKSFTWKNEASVEVNFNQRININIHIEIEPLRPLA